MSPARRAGAPRLIEWTGERCVPWAPDVQVVYEHFHRYLWAAPLVAGRDVLDLGSGEGFGSAILADTAAKVLGIDIDERTVEHSRLNYAAANLEFELGSALELSKYETGSFGAVVAFEIIEHVREQERVIAEIGRLLADDGILVISTPERRTYSEASGQRNPFHERELGQEEFLELLTEAFPEVAMWGQRAITGSHMHSLEGARRARETVTQDFYLERLGEEWRTAGEPAAIYCLAVASRSELPARAGSSTLADFGLELLRAKEHDVVVALNERDAAARDGQELLRELETERGERSRAARLREARVKDALKLRDRDIEQRQQDIHRLREKIGSLEHEIERGHSDLDGLRAEFARELESQRAELSPLEGELAEARLSLRRTEESVTWQAFQRARGRLYATLGGERSPLARAMGALLRLAGRALMKRAQPEPLPAPKSSPSIEPLPVAPEPEPVTEIEIEEIWVRRDDDPTVSLVIPLFAHAELTRACLESIREHTSHVSYEVVLVDDDADQETKSLLAAVRGARIIRNEKNLGYLPSVNRGAAAAHGRWLVLMNNDTEATPGWLAAMLDCAESAADVGVVTPKYLYPDGTLNEAGGIIWRDGTGANYGRGDLPDRFQYEYRRETDYGSAAALMVSADLWAETGGFDERYLPMYYEDVDLCFEARARGWRVLYEPTAVVIHVEGATAGSDPSSGYKRHQEENRPRFRAKWRQQLEAEHLPDSSANLRVAADRYRGPHVLLIDHCVPTWDQDAGSLRMLSIVQALLGLGARVSFMAENLSSIQPYTRALQRMGVEVLYGQLDVNAELMTMGPGLTAAILSRPHPSSRWMDSVREFAPSATVAYDTVDLHWLREARREALTAKSTQITGNGHAVLDGLGSKARALRELELAMIRASDVTLVVSESERAQIERDVPSARTILIPTVHEVETQVLPPEGRSGILFVGGFQHPPNADAAIRLVRDVMPAVWSREPDAKVTIVGSNPPPEVRALASPRVEIAGWLEDLDPLYDRSRVLVAPLRYGAGLKGKITQCLAFGLPVVTTSIGAEGIVGLEECLLVAEDTNALAEATLRLYRDDELWRELSSAGQLLIAARCSPGVVADRLGQLLKLSPTPAT